VDKNYVGKIVGAILQRFVAYVPIKNVILNKLDSKLCLMLLESTASFLVSLLCMMMIMIIMMMIIIMMMMVMTANSTGPEEGPVHLLKFCECWDIHNNEVGVQSG
jgi:hypothetical protein